MCVICMEVATADQTADDADTANGANTSEEPA